MKLIGKLGSRYRNLLNFNQRLEIHATDHEAAASGIAEQIYYEMLAILRELDQLRPEDFNLGLIREQLIFPIAQYLSQDSEPQFVKPIFVSGEPGIGKTTLLMILDEALWRPDPGSCRDLVATGEVQGYFAEKGSVAVTPLRLFGIQTAVLSTRDWANVLRHWTFDETVARYSDTALTDFILRLRGKVVIVDEAELEGYVYFTELLAQHGILVLLSSNLGAEHIRLRREQVNAVRLVGFDHRSGDIARVWLSNTSQELFERFSQGDWIKSRLLAGAQIATGDLDGRTIICLNWRDLEDRPLMKDDFARFFREMQPDLVLLDGVPMFPAVPNEGIDLTFLGHLARFVNFVDAVHDSNLGLLVRRIQRNEVENQDFNGKFKETLLAYDERVGSNYGKSAWIEWTRCVSRLRSREELNAAVLQTIQIQARNT